jgi:hypothetical protein
MSGNEWPEGMLPLTSLVAALREELAQARAAADPSMPFVVGPVTMEVNVVVRWEAEAKFGAKLFALLDTGVTGKAGRESGHKVTFTLTPRSSSGEDLVIHDTKEAAGGDEGAYGESDPQPPPL